MKDWRKKFALLLLLLLPLQALAGSLSVLTCYTGSAQHGATNDADRDHGPSHDNDMHDRDTPHQHDGDASVDHSGHLNCHHVVSGMPVVAAVSVPGEIPAFEPTLSLLSTLFVPERPQRPPRT